MTNSSGKLRDDEAEQTAADVGVLELGPGDEPDSRADTTIDVRHDPDIRHDLERVPWPLADASADGAVAHHVLEHLDNPVDAMHELARVVRPGGFIEIVVPVAGLATMDPTHRQFWDWRTVGYFDRDGPDHWSYDRRTPPLALEDRRFGDLWLAAPFSKASPALRALARRRPGQWVCETPFVQGELIARYRRLGGEQR